MFITTQNEIISLMPAARWDRPSQLFGYLEEEEQVALEPLLGMTLYQFLCTEYERLTEEYVDITATTIKPTYKAKEDPGLVYAEVTERLDSIQRGHVKKCACPSMPDEYKDVSVKDMQTVRLIRICQQIEFYKMLSHKAGLLTVSFNEGGGMNMVSADGYEPADDKRMERVVKDAYMSAGRAVDSLLLFLEADAKGDRLFTEKWQEADAFYLHKDLLFQTARVLHEYLDMKGGRMEYVQLVRDIRFCQNTYLKPRVGAKLLKAVVEYGNEGFIDVVPSDSSTSSSSDGDSSSSSEPKPSEDVMDELLSLLRSALAFFVDSRRTELGPKDKRLAIRDFMTDAMQAMAMACTFIEENLDELGDIAVDSPIYKKVKEAEAQAARDEANIYAAKMRRCKEKCEQARHKLFTAFPSTHSRTEVK